MPTPVMTYQALKNSVQLHALNDPSGVVAGSQEDLTYGQLINTLGLSTWEGERDVLWDELWVDVENATTISAGTTSINLPDDFKFIGGGYIRLFLNNTTRWMPVKMLRERVLNPQNDKHEFYISGNFNTGFQLLLGWTVNAGDPWIGATVSYCYYKLATVLDNAGDIPELSDPMYLVFVVAAQVAGLNYNWNLSQNLSAQAADRLTNMRTANEMASYYEDDYLKEGDWLLGRRSSIPNRLNSGYWSGR